MVLTPEVEPGPPGGSNRKTNLLGQGCVAASGQGRFPEEGEGRRPGTKTGVSEGWTPPAPEVSGAAPAEGVHLSTPWRGGKASEGTDSTPNSAANLSTVGSGKSLNLSESQASRL